MIEYYGDSTVWGYAPHTGERVTLPAPEVFAQVLHRKSSRYKVVNEGVNGSTSCGLLKGTDGKHPPWTEQMETSPARYIILNHGINDQWQYGIPEYAGCLRQLARIARKHGKTVFFETPNPTRNTGPDGLDRYADAMRQVATSERLPLIDQYAYLLRQVASQADIHAMCPDGLHPTPEVYALKGHYAATTFLKQVGKASARKRTRAP